MTRLIETVTIALSCYLAAQTLVPPVTAQSRPVNGLVLRITPRGIFPSQVTLTPGPLTITIINRTGHAATDFKINQVGDARSLASARIDLASEHKLQRASASVTLVPGEYALTVPDRPGVTCRITIKP